MKIIALDPGVTTGVAIGNIDDKGLMSVDAFQKNYQHIELFSTLQLEFPEHVICESFEYRNTSRSGVNLYPVELIGVVHLFIQGCISPVGLYMQNAATGKGFYSDNKLKEAGVYQRGVPHGMDALRHLLQWYTFGAGYQYNKKGFQ
jgi:hypothetical protein